MLGHHFAHGKNDIVAFVECRPHVLLLPFGKSVRWQKVLDIREDVPHGRKSGLQELASVIQRNG